VGAAGPEDAAHDDDERGEQAGEDLSLPATGAAKTGAGSGEMEVRSPRPALPVPRPNRFPVPPGFEADSTDTADTADTTEQAQAPAESPDAGPARGRTPSPRRSPAGAGTPPPPSEEAGRRSRPGATTR